jgi:aspartate/methionine/tyrosine aminotransferase
MKIEPFKLERYFARYEFNAPYLLCSSDCESMSVAELLAYEPGATAQMQQVWLGYTEYEGSPELRREICKLYQKIETSHILVHSGAEEAIYNFLNVALEPGDHLIVQYPCYMSFVEIARANGCEVSFWETNEADGWELDMSALPALIKPNTKAIVVNCPHNPTGYLMSHAKQAQLIEIAREHNLLLFSDEVYRGLEYKESDRLPPAADLYENAVSLGVMSKTYGLAGLRIGWIATRNEKLYRDMSLYKDYTSICNSAPSEFLATLALRHAEEIAGRNRNIILTNLPLLESFFSKWQHIFNWQRPIAGPIAFPSLKLEMGIDEFCQQLVEQQGVLLLPSDNYNFGNKNFRIGFGRKNLPESIERLDKFLEAM